MKKSFIAIVGLLMVSFGLPAQKLAPGVDIVGFGYDVFGRFADNSSKKPYQLFDLGTSKELQIGSDMYLVPSNVTIENIGRKEKTTVSGSSRREYAKSFGVSVGVDVDALTFGASVEASFSNSWGGSTQEYFYTIRDANRIWRIGLDGRLDLKTILDAQAKKDIETMEAHKLFDLYGTHVIVNAYLGGRADFTMVTKITEQYSVSDISAAASGSYGAVSANASTNFSSAQQEIISNSRETLTVTGGNAEYANDISNFEAYKLWADGIRTLPVLCDFDRRSLIPIWELASTQQRKNELATVFSELCKQHPLPEAMAGIGVGMANESFFVKAKSNESYWDFPGFHFDAQTKGGILGLAEKDANAGGLQGGDRFIKIIPHVTQAEYVFFQAQHAGEVVDVMNGSTSAGGQLWLYPKGDNNPAQMFRMVEVDGEANTYTIQNQNSGLFFTEKDGQITQEKETKADNQKWVFEKAHASQMAPPPAGRVYHIALNSTGLNLDVRNAGGNEAHVQLTTPSNHPAQFFQLYQANQGAYLLLPMHNRTLGWDMHAEEGAPLRVYQLNSSEPQKFVFQWAGFPRVYKIKLRNADRYLTADANYSSTPGHDVSGRPQGNPSLQDWTMQLSNSATIRNKYLNTWLYNVGGGTVYCLGEQDVNNDFDKALWNLEPAEAGFFYLVNRKDGTLLNIENGKLESTTIGRGSHSAMWALEKVPDDVQFSRIKNRWKGTYLNTEGNVTQCSPIQGGWDSARWELYYK